MWGFLDNLKIQTRIYLVAFLPLLGLAVFSGVVIYNQNDTRVKMARFQEVAAAIPEISGLVHELQKERGNSAGFIGARGKGQFGDMLAAQRQATNVALSGFNARVEQLAITDGGEQFADYVQQAKKLLARLPDRRNQVDELALSVGEMAQFYTVTIARLLDSIAATTAFNAEPATVKMINGYIAFLQAKERAGLERAMGSNGFGSGAFAPAIHRRFIALIAEQDAFLSIFRANATADQLAYYQQTVTGPRIEAVAAMRKTAIDSKYGGDTGAITGPQWFETITAKINLLKQVEDRLAADILAISKAAGKANTQLLIATAGFIAILLGVIFFACRMMGTRLTAPLAVLWQNMRALADGDHSVEIAGTDRRDEIGDMARSVLIFRDAAVENQKLATARVREQEVKNQRTEQIAELCRLFERNAEESLESFVHASSELRASADRMRVSADHSQGKSAAVASAAQQASSNVQSVAQASEELARSIGAVGQHVDQSTAISGNAITEAKRASDTINKLSDAAQKIGAVLALIQDIAEQTNLLALNATIEAARAGEAGKGFAVVATEVKNLATQTANATEEISHQMDGMQSVTDETVKVISAIQEIIDQIGENAHSIADAVGTQRMSTLEISENARQVAVGTSQVTENISGVSDAILETGAVAEQVFGAADALNGQSEKLRAEVANFLRDLKAA